MDSLILCKIPRGIFSDFFAESAEMLRLVTGWDMTADELQEIARRVTAAKSSSISEPAGRAMRTPFRRGSLPRPRRRSGRPPEPATNCKPPSPPTIQARGWTSEGRLTEDLLTSLGLAVM